jgi:hypothetical protein
MLECIDAARPCGNQPLSAGLQDKTQGFDDQRSHLIGNRGYPRDSFSDRDRRREAPARARPGESPQASKARKVLLTTFRKTAAIGL